MKLKSPKIVNSKFTSNPIIGNKSPNSNIIKVWLPFRFLPIIFPKIMRKKKNRKDAIEIQIEICTIKDFKLKVMYCSPLKRGIMIVIIRYVQIGAESAYMKFFKFAENFPVGLK